MTLHEALLLPEPYRSEVLNVFCLHSLMKGLCDRLAELSNLRADGLYRKLAALPLDQIMSLIGSVEGWQQLGETLLGVRLSAHVAVVN